MTRYIVELSYLDVNIIAQGLYIMDTNTPGDETINKTLSELALQTMMLKGAGINQVYDVLSAPSNAKVLDNVAYIPIR